jgi:hypothetical protein
VVAAVGVGPAGRVHGGGARHPVTGSVPAVGGWIWSCGEYWPAGDVRVCVAARLWVWASMEVVGFKWETGY